MTLERKSYSLAHSQQGNAVKQEPAAEVQVLSTVAATEHSQMDVERSQKWVAAAECSKVWGAVERQSYPWTNGCLLLPEVAELHHVSASLASTDP
ncbi:hypothetical protein [Edaphobacter albus]|uniref:hypothetical protein n=1 Tax=Edaphobacter sp. 4G125 TaxID=2763071 RepID=UPI001645FBD9|nr:hypothetical protein [Edaphobacter sp. 4G125]QNI36997.1 hypothetical protein H7846_01250 [Edaphobacter sp. 4G125]